MPFHLMCLCVLLFVQIYNFQFRKEVHDLFYTVLHFQRTVFWTTHFHVASPFSTDGRRINLLREQTIPHVNGLKRVKLRPLDNLFLFFIYRELGCT